MRMVVNGLSKTNTRQLVEPPSYQYILTQYIISPIIWSSQQVPIWKGKTYQRSFIRVFTVALKANLARHHERLSDANCRNRSNEAHMKDFFEPRLKFPPHIWHRQLGYKIYSFCTHVCRGLAFADWLQLVCMIGSVWQDDNLQTGKPACLVAMYVYTVIFVQWRVLRALQKVGGWYNATCHMLCTL